MNAKPMLTMNTSKTAIETNNEACPTGVQYPLLKYKLTDVALGNEPPSNLAQELSSYLKKTHLLVSAAPTGTSTARQSNSFKQYPWQSVKDPASGVIRAPVPNVTSGSSRKYAWE
eukprot:NODE_472_length_8038_cov_0.413150.p8 type:complete len:115 gc:universal NODE_472_length_8038_cov_0.413150:1710-2054(+)